MTIIDSETVVVFNFNELKTVLEGNTYNYIYFGDNITLGSTGINVNSSRSVLTIDGTYQNVRYTYEDYTSAAYTQTILIQGAASGINVTVKNIDIIGHNYYGVVCVYDSANFINVVVTYENINYTGPQLAFNPYSSLRIIDSEINIVTSTSSANEVAETRNVTLGGNVTINSTTTSTSIFWFRNVVGGVIPYFNVLPGANINITSTNMYLYYVSSAEYIDMTFGSNSTTSITTALGLSYYDTHYTRNVLIDSEAQLNIEQTTQWGTTATWIVRGEFKMNTGSSLKMISNYTGSTSNYCLQFTGTNPVPSLILNNPKSLIFYCNPANAIYASNSTNFTINISQYNRWTSVTSLFSAGDIYDIPTYSWYKLENTNNLTVTGTFLNNNTIISTTNLTPGEQAELPALSNFLITGTRVLSFGRPSLSLNPISDTSLDMTGTTEPNADIKITYDGNDYYVQADNTGEFIYSYSPALPSGTKISFVSNVAGSFLYRFRTVEIIFNGDIYITEATDEITFDLNPFQFSPTLCNRANPLKVVIQDNRIVTSPWDLYATVNIPLINEKGSTLPDGLVFINDLGNMIALSDTPTLVYSSFGTPGTTDVEWDDNEGILLQLNIIPIVANTTYRANINWIIE
ncbi:MAG: hypothetical protein GX265_04295 [Mollicutes bacterium]|nr:hypothetical protein [Mollicutes bacterium]